MGFLAALSGRKKILSFEIIFDDNNSVGVIETKYVPIIQNPDYIRLWACYQAKVLYSLDYPKNLSANMSVTALTDIVEKKIDVNTDCFQLANLEDVIQYLPNLFKGNIKFTGEFYAKGSLGRTIKTKLPLRGTEQQLVYSVLALMQYTISVIQDDDESLDVYTKTARNMIELYESGLGAGMSAVVKIPTLAYMQAIGLDT